MIKNDSIFFLWKIVFNPKNGLHFDGTNLNKTWVPKYFLFWPQPGIQIQFFPLFIIESHSFRLIFALLLKLIWYISDLNSASGCQTGGNITSLGLTFSVFCKQHMAHSCVNRQFYVLHNTSLILHFKRNLGSLLPFFCVLLRSLNFRFIFSFFVFRFRFQSDKYFEILGIYKTNAAWMWDIVKLKTNQTDGNFVIKEVLMNNKGDERKVNASTWSSIQNNSRDGSLQYPAYVIWLPFILQLSKRFQIFVCVF